MRVPGLYYGGRVFRNLEGKLSPIPGEEVSQPLLDVVGKLEEVSKVVYFSDKLVVQENGENLWRIDVKTGNAVNSFNKLSSSLVVKTCSLSYRSYPQMTSVVELSDGTWWNSDAGAFSWTQVAPIKVHMMQQPRTYITWQGLTLNFRNATTNFKLDFPSEITKMIVCDGDTILVATIEGLHYVSVAEKAILKTIQVNVAEILGNRILLENGVVCEWDQAIKDLKFLAHAVVSELLKNESA